MASHTHYAQVDRLDVVDTGRRRRWSTEEKLRIDMFVFRGRRGDLIKVLWTDAHGVSLYAKRLERGRFIWPSPADGVVVITPAQLAYMLEGIDWRHPQHTWRPKTVG